MAEQRERLSLVIRISDARRTAAALDPRRAAACSRPCRPTMPRWPTRRSHCTRRRAEPPISPTHWPLLRRCSTAGTSDEAMPATISTAADSADVPMRIRGDVDEAIPSATSQIIEAFARIGDRQPAAARTCSSEPGPSPRRPPAASRQQRLSARRHRQCLSPIAGAGSQAGDCRGRCVTPAVCDGRRRAKPGPAPPRL